MGGLFKKPKVEPMPKVPSISDPDIQKRAREEAVRHRLMAGYAGLNLTSGKELGDPNTLKHKLGGM